MSSVQLDIRVNRVPELQADMDPGAPSAAAQRASNAVRDFPIPSELKRPASGRASLACERSSAVILSSCGGIGVRYEARRREVLSWRWRLLPLRRRLLA